MVSQQGGKHVEDLRSVGRHGPTDGYLVVLHDVHHVRTEEHDGFRHVGERVFSFLLTSCCDGEVVAIHAEADPQRFLPFCEVRATRVGRFCRIYNTIY